jgi:hypothetical protein
VRTGQGELANRRQFSAMARRISKTICASEPYRTKTKGECATHVSTSVIESLRRSGRVAKCGGLENR